MNFERISREAEKASLNLNEIAFQLQRKTHSLLEMRRQQKVGLCNEGSERNLIHQLRRKEDHTAMRGLVQTL